MRLVNVNACRAANEVNQAQQEKEKLINEARRDYNKVIPLAEGEKDQRIREADGYRLKRINEAEGDVARFSALLAEYIKAPIVTRRRIYIETLQDVMPPPIADAAGMIDGAPQRALFCWRHAHIAPRLIKRRRGGFPGYCDVRQLRYGTVPAPT